MAKESIANTLRENEAFKNLIIVLGITILLVAGVVGAGLIISRIAEEPAQDGEIIASSTDNNDVTIEFDEDETPDESNLDSDDLIFEDVTDESQTEQETPETQPTPQPEPQPEPETTPEQPTDNNDNDDQQPSSGNVLSQTATAGDSFSWLARRAMYHYMGERGLGLDTGARLYFEVTLTQLVDDGSLEPGDTIQFSISDLDRTFAEAQGLDSFTLAAWTHQANSVGYF